MPNGLDTEIQQGWLTNPKVSSAEILNSALMGPLFHHAIDGYLLVDNAGSIRGANASLLKLLDYQRADLEHAPLERLIPASSRRDHRQNLQDFFALGSIRPMGSGLPLFALTRQGESIPVDIELFPLSTQDERLVLARLHDRRDDLRQEDRFRLAEQFRVLVEGAQDHAIVLLDDTGRITTWNIGAERNKGYRASEIIGRNFELFYSAEDRARGQPRADLAAARALGNWSTEGWRIRKDGRRFWASVSLTALKDLDGGFIGFAKVTRDVSERMEAEQRIRELNVGLERRVAERTKELQDANAELESFAYTVSHDLRAPLRAMSGFAQALEEDFGAVLPDAAHHHLAEIVAASRRMGELIDGILRLSRVVRGELEDQPVELSRLAQTIADELSANSPERRFIWHIAPGLRCRGDRRMMEAALRNLLGNAVKYTAGRTPAEIAFFAEQSPTGPVFHISDNGAGFDMAHAGQLFQPFQRLHRQDEFPGIGIGLATVQRIVRRHGGAVSATAKPGQGADFSFTLGAGRCGGAP